MGEGKLTIYSASAGSGKTFQLARIYLSLLFRSKYNYRKILAVTFTNKATAEMKSRILEQLFNLASNKRSDYLGDIVKDTGKTETQIRTEAGEILSHILHDFSRFSVSTIDTFFQKVLRAFTREAGLHSGFNIELDHTLILESAVEETIASAADDPDLQRWLKDYVLSNLEEEKSWDLKKGIMQLSEELFRERFKILSAGEIAKLENKEFLLGYIDKLKSVLSSFEKNLQSLGQKALEIYHRHELSDDMFFQKSRGVPAYIRSLGSGTIKKPNNSVREIMKDPPRWSAKEPSPPLLEAIGSGLEELLREAVVFYDKNFLLYNSVKAVFSNIYALGILSDVLRRVRMLATSENSFLLSDAGEVLSLITGEDQTPFIYEKIGNKFENYMIDEFQDTSILQWSNFQPLIVNSLGEGHDNLVVGDIKQSIYRWRNSDWRILAEIQAEAENNRRFITKPLKTNWRSRANIIKFNNSLFSLIPAQVQSTFPEDQLSVRFTDLYSESIQNDPVKCTGGYIRLEFIDNEYDKENDTGNNKRKISKKWDEIVLQKLPLVIETFLSKGYRASDIGILVRERKEGEAVLRRIIEYGNASCRGNEKGYNYNIVSNDSLTLSSSYVITFIISVIKVLNDPDDLISRALMLRFYLLAMGNDNAGSVTLYSEKLREGSFDCFPAGTEAFLGDACHMSLFEATENIIRHFSLGKYPWNVAYLNTFQDWVMNFSGKKNADFQTFLDWWDSTGNTKSVVLPDNLDAAKVYTIHKSKGLEFKVVILPFLSWDLDHKSSKQPVLWVRPEEAPLSDIGKVPVKYSQKLIETIFAGNYITEKCSSYLDNINLLYVAMTRAKDAIYAFAPEAGGSHIGISTAIKNAFQANDNNAGESGVSLRDLYNETTRVFEFGEIPVCKDQPGRKEIFESHNYLVNPKSENLRLKLHGENYLLNDMDERKQKINYGRLMHEVFEGIDTIKDIPPAVKKLVLEGKIPESESTLLIKKFTSLISEAPVNEWFSPENKVMKEAEILMPSGSTRRPDRVILKDDRAVIIDFKFGDENPQHLSQLRQYRTLLTEMGYGKTEAFIWYVDNNKVITV